MAVISFVGRVWANGEFGLSREREYEPSEYIDAIPQCDREWNTNMLKVHGLWECLRYAESQRNRDDAMGDGCPRSADAPLGVSAHLGSSLVANSHRADRGQSGISRYGGKLVRNASFVMQKETGLGRLSFLTLTLPNVSKDDAVSCAENWAEIVRVLVQRLRRNLRKSGLPGEIVGCTEVQEQRSALTGVFGLHLHFCFVGRLRRRSWAISPKQVKSMWKSALQPYLSNPVDDYNWTATEQIVKVRKDASGYLGKYMSKGLKSCQKLRALFPDVRFPACWYVCTNSLRSRVKAKVLRVTGALGIELRDMIEAGNKDHVAYSAPVKILVGEREVTIGYCGRLTPDGVEAFQAYINYVRDDWSSESVIFSNQFVK